MLTFFKGYDSSASYLYNQRSYVSVTEIDMDLQSSTEHWEAESVEAWAALHPWTDSTQPNHRFKTVIRSFFDGLGLRMSRKALSSALAWTVYEELIGRAERHFAQEHRTANAL